MVACRDPAIPADEVDEVRPLHQELGHDRVVVFGFGEMAIGAHLGVGVARQICTRARRAAILGILGVARISGETAPLLFTSLNNQYWSTGLSEPTASLPVMIFYYALSAYDDWHRQAWAGGLVLLLLVLLANVGCRMVINRRGAVRSV